MKYYFRDFSKEEISGNAGVVKENVVLYSRHWRNDRDSFALVGFSDIESVQADKDFLSTIITRIS